MCVGGGIGWGGGGERCAEHSFRSILPLQYIHTPLIHTVPLQPYLHTHVHSTIAVLPPHTTHHMHSTVSVHVHTVCTVQFQYTYTPYAQ